jgi:hypothetical protein
MRPDLMLGAGVDDQLLFAPNQYDTNRITMRTRLPATRRVKTFKVKAVV